MILTKQAVLAQLHAALAQIDAMRADNKELREVLSQMLAHFGNTKRDEWINDEGFAAAQAVEAKARALVLFVPQFPYAIPLPNSNT